MANDGDDRKEGFEKAAAEAARIAPEPETAAGAAPGVGSEAKTPLGTQPPSLPDEAKEKASEFVAEWVPFGVMAKVRGAHWRVTAEQVRELAPAWADVLDKYWPEWWKFSGPEARLLLILGLTVFSKIQIEREIRRRLEEQVEEAHRSAAAPATAAPPPSPAPAAVPADEFCEAHRLKNCPECHGDKSPEPV